MTLLQPNLQLMFLRKGRCPASISNIAYFVFKLSILAWVYFFLTLVPPLPRGTCRIEAFNSLFGQHMRANHLDLISVADIENVVNSGADFHYVRTEIMFLLEVRYLI